MTHNRKRNTKIFVAGHKGMVGSAILRKISEISYNKNQVIIRDRSELDLINQKEVNDFFADVKPDQVYIAAAKVGGIYANNKWPADFIYQNLMIQSNLINAAFKADVKKLLFLGSSCIYPKITKQPMKESALLSGYLEPTNEPYAIAKIAGIKLCESYNYQYGTNYLCLMPTNTFGPNDNFDLLTSHFIPALIKKTHYLIKSNKKILKIWGNGLAKREVIYVDDIAKACIYFMNKKTRHSLINIGTGRDYSIRNYAKKILKILNVNAKIVYDRSKPNGTLRKLMNISLAKSYGWKPITSFEQGVKLSYHSYLTNINKKK